jgi:hypothetical protein
VTEPVFQIRVYGNQVDTIIEWEQNSSYKYETYRIPQDELKITEATVDNSPRHGNESYTGQGRTNHSESNEIPLGITVGNEKGRVI